MSTGYTTDPANQPSSNTAGYSRAAVPRRPLNDDRFAFHTVVFILACFAFFAVLSWPRLLTRFSRGAEWTRGHLIYHSTKPQRRLPAFKRRPTISRPLEARYEKGRAPNSEDDHTNFSHIALVRREGSTKLSLPPHCRSWSGIFQKSTAFLGIRIDEGLSLGRCIVLLCYLAVILFLSLYKSNPFNDYVRTGFVSTAQIPLVYALATKNNVIGRFLSIGYEKLNYLHRFSGSLAVLAANVHAIGYVYSWAKQGNLVEKLESPPVAFGVLSLIAADLLFSFSTAFWRRRFYNVFLFSHTIGIIVIPIGIAFHMPVTIPWMIAAGGAYGLDYLIRVFKTRIATATLRPIPELGMTRIEIPHLNAGWRPGQHVRLRVLSTGLGFFGWAEVHPFTIASISGDGITLMVKKAGDWSNKLYDMATKSDAIYSGDAGNGMRAKVWVEGPYGGVGNTMMDSYSGAVFLAGGSGITFALSAVTDLVQKDFQGASRLKVIHLIWCVQDAQSLQPMIPTFAALLQQAVCVKLQISVHYTRASTFNARKVYAHLPLQLAVTPGRPRISSVIDATIDHACKLFTPYGQEHHASDKLSGILVGVCGPSGLGEEVRKAVSSIDPSRFRKVGGVEVVEETFGW